MSTGYPDSADQGGADRELGFPDTVDDASPERELLDDPQESALPGDDYLAADDYGTTVQEQLTGESLDERLARELPDPNSDPVLAAGSDRSDEELERSNRLLSDPEGATVGRLVEPDEGAHTDLEKDVVAREVTGGERDVSAEEAAMHVETEV